MGGEGGGGKDFADFNWNVGLEEGGGILCITLRE